MGDVEIFANRGTPNQGHAVTDANGKFVLKDLPPGSYRIAASAPDTSGRIGFGPSLTRQVVLLPGQELESFDFHLVLLAQISGRVLDQNKEPVPDASVFLVVREYVSGVLRAVFAGGATTDDQGEYHLGRVQPGRTYEVIAKTRNFNLPAISDAPADPKLRRPALTPTFYPNSRSVEGAQSLVLRSGEVRENVDIRLTKTPSFCLEGVVEGGTGSGGLRFEIAEAQPTSGSSGNGGFYMSQPNGRVGAEGKIRICGLHPGDYELAALEYKTAGNGLAFFGAAPVTITDRDLQNVHVVAGPPVPLKGQVVWDGPAPAQPLDTKINMQLQALSRTERGFLKLDIPSDFALEGGLLIDEFSLRFDGVPKGVYIKDVSYGGRSIRYEPLRLGTAMGDAGLRIALSQDGGSITAQVADKDGNPVPDCTVVLMPASAPNEAALSVAMITGKSDLRGTWSPPVMAPGKYYAVATNDMVDKSPECMAKLWRMRTGAPEVEVSASGNAPVSLTPKSIE
jgi:hypothetical protein